MDHRPDDDACGPRRRSALVGFTRLAGTAVVLAGVLTAALFTASSAMAQTGTTTAPAPAVWPTRPVRLLVGFPGGSTPDMAARALAEGLAKALGQPVVVDNRPGASGNLAADAVAKAGDDHTLGIVINGNLTSARQLNPRLPYDPAKDFSLLSLLGTAPLVLVGPADQPGGADYIKAARAAGAAWSYGSVGIGSVGHLGMEVVKTAIGYPGSQQPVHVPYNGNPAVVTALIGGQIQMALVPPGIALPQVKAGKLHAIGLAGPRSALAPDIAPLSELGLPIFRTAPLEVWVALVGPASLSKPAQDRLARELPALVRDSETRQRLLAAGWEPQGSTPEALKTRVADESRLLGDIITARGIKLE